MRSRTLTRAIRVLAVWPADRWLAEVDSDVAEPVGVRLTIRVSGEAPSEQELAWADVVVAETGPDLREEDLAGAPVLWLASERGRSVRDASRSIVAASGGPARLAAAIVAVAEGLWVSDTGPAPAAHGLADRAEPLTARETEILQLMSAGLSNRAIAERLSVSEHTVKSHVRAVLGKLGAGSRTEAVSMAARRGLVLL